MNERAYCGNPMCNNCAEAFGFPVGHAPGYLEQADSVESVQSIKRITADFCATFSTKEKCVGAMAKFIPIHLPLGVDGTDPRVKQIQQWCIDNAIEVTL